jgi:hypothetical protein
MQLRLPEQIEGRMYLKPKRPRSSHGDFTSSTQNVPVPALDRAETTNGRKGREADAPTKSPAEGGTLPGTLKDRCRIPQHRATVWIVDHAVAPAGYRGCWLRLVTPSHDSDLAKHIIRSNGSRSQGRGVELFSFHCGRSDLLLIYRWSLLLGSSWFSNFQLFGTKPAGIVNYWSTIIPLVWLANIIPPKIGFPPGMRLNHRTIIWMISQSGMVSAVGATQRWYREKVSWSHVIHI